MEPLEHDFRRLRRIRRIQAVVDSLGRLWYNELMKPVERNL